MPTKPLSPQNRDDARTRRFEESIFFFSMTSAVTQRRVARALRPGGPEVIGVGIEDLPPLEAGEVLVRVEAAGLNHAETLILSGKYVVRVPFPGHWAVKERAP